MSKVAEPFSFVVQSSRDEVRCPQHGTLLGWTVTGFLGHDYFFPIGSKLTFEEMCRTADREESWCGGEAPVRATRSPLPRTRSR